jgi:hypothetical protein
MKLIQKLALATTGMAMAISAVGAEPASAAEFVLSGTFNGFLESTSPLLTSLDSFDGIYSVDEFPVSAPVSLTSWNINLRNQSGNVVFNFNNLAPSASASIGPSFSDPSSPTDLRFEAGLQELLLRFPPSFDGTGTTDDGLFRNNLPPDTFGFTTGRFIETATSQPVPEPITFAGSMLALGIGWRLKKFKKHDKDKDLAIHD